MAKFRSRLFYEKTSYKNRVKCKSRARPGFEPGTSRIRSANHTPRPTSHAYRMDRVQKILYKPIKVVNILRLRRFSANKLQRVNLFSGQVYGKLFQYTV